MGVFSSGSQVKKAAREQKKTQRRFAGQAIEEIEGAKARTKAAEEARYATFSLLGQPGTYAPPGSPSSGVPGASTGTSAGLFKTSGPDVEASKLAEATGQYNYGPRKDILDPEAYAQAASQTTPFQIQSYRTAEAYQLLRQEGPMWDMLENSTLGRLHQGAATRIREDLRELRNQAAKGGSARRSAFQGAERMLKIEEANRDLSQQVFDANIKLFKTIRANADQVQTGNMNFLDNLPLVRDSYVNTMNSLSNMMVSTALPTAAKASALSYNAAVKQATTKTFLDNLAAAGIAIGAAVIGYGLGGEMGAGLGLMAGQMATQSPSEETGVGTVENLFSENLGEALGWAKNKLLPSKEYTPMTPEEGAGAAGEGWSIAR